MQKQPILTFLTSLTLFASILCGDAMASIKVTDIKGFYLGENPSRDLLLARTTFYNGMLALYGIKVHGLKEPADGPMIILGKAECLKRGLITEAELKEVAPGGYVVRTKNGTIGIAGQVDSHTKYGVVRLLDRMGYRIYGDGLYKTRRVARALPQKGNEIAAYNYSEKPVMPIRNFNTRGDMALCDKALWELNPELKGKIDCDLWIDHSAGFLIPKDLYYDEHPEYFALLKTGERIKKDAFSYHRTAICLSHPDVIRISKERALKWVELQNDKTIFPITYGDTGLWCQCDDCMALDDEPGAYAGRLMNWVNAVAEAIYEKYPDKLIYTFAYGGSDAAPKKLKPMKNVYPVLSSSMDTPFFDHAMAIGKLDGVIKKIEGWRAFYPESTTVCEYSGGKYLTSVPDQLQSKLRWYAKNGVKGIMFSFGDPNNLKPLWHYLYPRLMWDPEADALALAQDFAKHYYGPAGEHMAAYLTAASKSYHRTNVKDVEMSGLYPKDFYAPAFLKEAGMHLAKAAEAVKVEAASKAEALKLPPEQKKRYFIYQDVKNEAFQFISDALKHPASETLTDEVQAGIIENLNLLETLTADKVALARQVNRIGIVMDRGLKGSKKIVDAWLEERNFPKPQGVLTKSGIQFPAETFMYGFGPVTYRGGHVGPPGPPKLAVGVYVKGNSQNRSHRMEANFELDEVRGNGSGDLYLHGQDCDHAVKTAEIDVLLNGKSLFAGQVSAVKWNWSKQKISIPAGGLKPGNNVLEIVNIADPKTSKNWFERWYLLADAEIKFGN